MMKILYPEYFQLLVDIFCKTKLLCRSSFKEFTRRTEINSCMQMENIVFTINIIYSHYYCRCIGTGTVQTTSLYMYIIESKTQ